MTTVENTGWHVGFKKIACTKIVRAATGLGLADGKRITDGVLARTPQFIAVHSDDMAQRLVRDLTEIGAVARVSALTK
jgi:ribosomal protein L7/L12